MTDSDEIEMLQARLSYNEKLGVFSWKGVKPRTPSRTGHAGTRCANGYIKIIVNGKSYMAHRMAMAFVHGHWPPCLVDHINRDPADNRISNLRFATCSENGRNRRRRRDSKSGVKGVSWCCQTRKWKASIQVHGVEKTIGRFPSIPQAAEAYAAKARELHGEFANFELVGGSHY